MNPALLASIEDASLNASAPPQQRWLDGWLVRYCPGKAKRARSINAVAAGRLPIADKLDRAEAIYREAGLPMIARITPFSAPASLDDELAARGWLVFDETCVMVRDLAAAAAPSAAPPGCTLRRVGSAEFTAAIGALRGSTSEQRDGQLRRLESSPVPYQGWLLERAGELLACGQFAREGRFVGLYDIFTVANARGQGLAQWLCRALLASAIDEGAALAYLQVDAGNAPALAVYRRLGFSEGYRYHYRAVDPAAAV